MNDTPTLVLFYMGYVEDGIGKDGLPLYKEQLQITLSRPPLLRIDRVATEDDIDTYPQAYAVFEKQQAAIAQKHEDGYPLVMWPACTPPLFQMLAARGVSTVEGLAKLSGRGKEENLPAEIRELAGRAKLLIEMQNSGGKYETIITELKGQIEALKEQVTEANAIINSQKATIATLKTAA